MAWIEDALAEWYGSDPKEWHANECLHIAKSVTRYCRRNLASGQTQLGLKLIAAARGRSGVARRKGTPLEQDRAPWKAEGLSRRTWYRRRGTELKQDDGVFP